MRTRQLAFGWVLGAALLSVAREAGASGGLFQASQGAAKVTEHHIAMSLSQHQTSLWDGMLYSGNPSDFAWVLPVHGTVQVALSSDELFARTSQVATALTQSPNIFCPCPSSSGTGGCGPIAETELETTNMSTQALVGPYETTQLPAGDAPALRTWLTSHGFVVPSSVDATLDAYAMEGYGFLAMRLLPGQGVSAMRPIRVTMPGYQPTIPLRLMASGAPDVVPISLFLVGDRRYEPANMPVLTVDPSAFLWDYGTHSSNYATLRDALFTAEPNGWLLEYSEAVDIFNFQEIALQVGLYAGSYADAQAAGAADYAALIEGANGGPALTLTRFSARMPRSALTADLEIHEAPDQSTFGGVVTKMGTGTTPTCPPVSGTTNASSSSGQGAGGSASSGGVGQGGQGQQPSSSSSCQEGSATPGSGIPFAALGSLLALIATRARRTLRARSRAATGGSDPRRDAGATASRP